MADPVKQHVLDRLLHIAAERAAAPSGIRFTERQLYYELCRVFTPPHRASRRFAFTVPAPLSYATFRTALDRQEFPGLLTPTPPRTTRAGLHTPEPDLFDYGLPRLLVCESDAIAQMLRANGLPMESACPVLNASELPLDPGIAEMLARVDGTIYLLHDASPHGLTFPARLADLTEIPEGVRVVPLGLRPRQAGTLHLTHLRGAMSSAVAAQIDPREREALHRSESSAQIASMDSLGRAELHDPESSAETAQVRSSERQISASSARATQVDSRARDVPRPVPRALGPVPHALAAQLDSWERAWLRRGRFVEIEAVRPASLLRTVHRLVREVRPPRTGLPEFRRARTTGFMTWPAA
ncbi:hypothetical protein [Nocardia pseudovaccinii]|uniref:hypothetical protein n=1 Tax=Nocardia pseudovaccinii TaxID=189540 RepID=UPI0007A4E017|nr:hypothetical protein [Nocardia pseudovaccinii]